MIQELLGSNSGFIGVGGERKIFSINGSSGLVITEPTTTLLPHHSTMLISPSTSSPSLPSSTSSSSSSTLTASAANNSAENSNSNNNQLRCPRCDSANTKFCYYNNYNLTQPRHFCKTCRRYWTKGGALRNVPIGGGCRKNKAPPSPASSSAASKPLSKIKPFAPLADIAGRPASLAGFDHFTESPSPILWGSPQNSHLLALLRSPNHPNYQNPSHSPNPNLSSLTVKQEAVLSGSHMASSCDAGAVSLGRSLGLDPVGLVPSLGLCSSLWRSSSSSSNNSGNVQSHGLQFGQHNGFTLRDHSNGNSGIQELYQRLRSPSSSSPGNGLYGDQSAAVVLTHHVGSSASSSSILESTPVNGGGELGFWNNSNTSFTWSDLQANTTANGAYP